MPAPYSENNRVVTEPIASVVATLVAKAIILLKLIKFSTTDPISPVCI
jgi:hypothetical protein